jgi:cytochrome P450
MFGLGDMAELKNMHNTMIDPTKILGAFVAPYCILLVVGFVVRRREKARLKLAPLGDMGYYLLGQMAHYLTSIEDFDRTMIHRYGENHLSHFFLEPVVRIGSFEDRNVVTRSEGKGHVAVSWPSHFQLLFGKNALTVVSGAKHQAARRFFHSAFTPDLLRGYVDTAHDCIRQFLLRLADGNEHQSEEFKALSLMILIRTVFNGAIDSEDEIDNLHNLFAEYIAGFTSIIPLNLPFLAYGRALRARASIAHTLEQLMIRCESTEINQKAGLLQRMVRYRDESNQGFSREEICDHIIVLLFAGHETTASVFGTLLALIFDNANTAILEQLRDEVKSTQLIEEILRKCETTNAVIDETLRRYPPINGFMRRASTDLPLSGGYLIPEGTATAIYVTAAHTDHEAWRTPNSQEIEKFDPTRMPLVRKFKPETLKSHFIPFGQGARLCVGEPLARLELRLFLYTIARDWHVEILDVQHVSMPVTKLACKFKLRRLNTVS